MGTYNVATIRGLAGRQVKANQQSVMRTGDIGRHAELGLKPTPWQVRKKRLEQQLKELNRQINCLVWADNFDTPEHRTELVNSLVQSLEVRQSLKQPLTELKLGNIFVTIRKDGGMEFHGSPYSGLKVGKYETAYLFLDHYVLVNAEGVHPSSEIYLKLCDEPYYYLNSQVWEYCRAHAEPSTDPLYSQAYLSLFLEKNAPRYRVYRELCVRADGAIVNEEFKVTPASGLPVSGRSLAGICAQVAKQHADQLAANAPHLVRCQPVSLDDTLIDLTVGQFAGAKTEGVEGFYLPNQKYDNLYDTMGSLRRANCTYGTLADAAKVAFARCQQYYDILQDALKLYQEQQA